MLHYHMQSISLTIFSLKICAEAELKVACYEYLLKLELEETLPFSALFLSQELAQVAGLDCQIQQTISQISLFFSQIHF